MTVYIDRVLGLLRLHVGVYRDDLALGCIQNETEGLQPVSKCRNIRERVDLRLAAFHVKQSVHATCTWLDSAYMQT